MLTRTSADEIASLLKNDHPTWASVSIQRQAQSYVETLDGRLEDLIRAYLATGTMKNFRHKDFSVLQIQHLVPGRSYFDAILLMDAYLKDERSGRALILRRQ